ncbi:hypothetical protein [Candidatus Marinarcus aquaticus]|uniref:Uncharacterized protein n=1 Tax=Candidatus Marinarcus aquaticus TaxID=2044504 RepID=A0A4V1LP21_9BACT|nr:hypothetical protein [Candidatus Marinarcus aquaticus]RXJ58000.1 hypothetical protein CRV04_05705 [Candidatus Marinarcus aquaticus]
MLILIPMNSNKRHEALITTLDQTKDWALIELDEGEIKDIRFFKRRDEIDEWIDCVVVENEQEYVWPFMEENITVLVAPTQKSIDEIVEAFLFKELHDLNV